MKSMENEKLERLTTAIQKNLAGNPSLLIGSGGSVPYGLPSMKALSAEIIRKLGPLYQTDTAWKSFITELSTSGNFESALDKAFLSNEIHNAVIDTIWSFIDMKDREAIVEFLKHGTFPSLTLILRKFVQKTDATNIVTTNYDRLIEFAIDSAQGAVKTGFTGDCVKAFGCFQINGTKRIVNLFKVHGSIDWFKHRINHNIMSTGFFSPETLSDIYEPMIVTPGRDKFRETHNDPFRTVMSEADAVLRKSASYLCLGYGFNDEHIQPIIIEENRNKNKPVVIVTKELTAKIEEFFLRDDNSNCLIISENPSGGTVVHYSKSDKECFSEDFWKLDLFYKIWFE